MADIQIRQESTTSTNESSFEIQNVVRSISSLYDQFLGNLLTPLNEVSNMPNEDNSGVSGVSVVSVSDDDDDSRIGSEGISSEQVKSRNYSPFQETEKAAAVRKQAMLQEQEANVRRLRQQEINETLAQKLRIERNVAEQKSRSFSPFPKKQSSSPSSKLPYSASKIVDDAVVDACADEDATASELGVSSEMNPEVVQVWTPGKMVRQ